MKRAICTLKSVAPLCFGKYHQAEKKEKELAKDYEARTWREKLHYDPDTEEVFIPPMMFSNSIKVAAKYLNISIPGKGKSTYTKNFDAGIMVTSSVRLGIKKNEVEPLVLFVPADGRPGGTTRVEKTFPVVNTWKGKVEFYIFDDIITEDIFTEVLKQCGNLIGIGSFRPRNRGWMGRFEVEKIEWIED